MDDMTEQNRTSLGRLLSDTGFRIKKHLGQNFLTDRNILEKIVREAGVTRETYVIEIGPGLGSLTLPLSAAAKAVLAYEIDPELIPILNEAIRNTDNVTVLNRDILKADIDADIQEHFRDAANVIVVANLPYYITTPILMRFLETSKRVRRLVLMMQDEVARRVTSNPSTKDYNALTVAIRYRADARYLFKVPRTVFVPEPNVDSAVVMVSIDRDREIHAIDDDLFNETVHRCFSQRRKTIINNLIDKNTINSRTAWTEILNRADIDPMCRAETLDVSDFVRLADAIRSSRVGK